MKSSNLYGNPRMRSKSAAIHVSSAGTITNRNKNTGIKMGIPPVTALTAPLSIQTVGVP